MANTIVDPTGLDPTGYGSAARLMVRRSDRAVLAPQRATLRGATVGLLENTKQNAAQFLWELGRLLIDRYGAESVVIRTKPAFALPVPEELLEEMASRCDAVITGVGDCGSCSASAVVDGVALERRGVPTAVVCSDAFVVSADAMAKVQGATGYHYATTAHPVAVLTGDEVRKRAEELLPEIVSILAGAEVAEAGR